MPQVTWLPRILCTVYCLLSTKYCLLSSVYCLLLTVYYLISTVYCILSTVYCLLCHHRIIEYFLHWLATIAQLITENPTSR